MVAVAICCHVSKQHALIPLCFQGKKSKMTLPSPKMSVGLHSRLGFRELCFFVLSGFLSDCLFLVHGLILEDSNTSIYCSSLPPALSYAFQSGLLWFSCFSTLPSPEGPWWSSWLHLNTAPSRPITLSHLQDPFCLLKWCPWLLRSWMWTSLSQVKGAIVLPLSPFSVMLASPNVSWCFLFLSVF